MQPLNETGALFQDAACRIRDIVGHLKDEARAWGYFRQRFQEALETFDTRITESRSRNFPQMTAGVSNYVQLTFENKRRKGFMFTNVGDQDALIKFGPQIPTAAGTADATLIIPKLTAGQVNVLSCPTMIPLWTGSMYLWFTTSTAGNPGINFTEFT